MPVLATLIVSIVALVGAALAVSWLNERAAGEVLSRPLDLERASPRPLPVADHPPTHEADGRLRKCVSPDGAVSFVDRPCAAGEETVWSREIAPEPEPAPPKRTAISRTSEAMDPGMVSRPDRGKDADARCERAKAREAEYRRARGLKITFDELRELGDMVYEACKDT